LNKERQAAVGFGSNFTNKI